MSALWWRPLARLSAGHVRLICSEGLLEPLEERAQSYRSAAEAAKDGRVRGELMRRAAMLREAKIALEQAGT